MRYFLLAFLLLCLSRTSAQEGKTYKEKQGYKSWVRLVPTLDDDFFRSEEAVRIADNVLLYQHTTGGWPKNVFMPAELTPQEREALLAAKNNVNESTIDNDATTTEIRYLSRVYLATGTGKYRDAALEGIRYILRSQYDNGGFPQFYPRPTGYYTHITYNDNAMLNVMQLLRAVSERQAPYGYIPDDLCRQARTAFDKGIDCILKTQVVQEGHLTVWCAQHDEHTLAPAKARAYELPSLSGSESNGLVLLLMSLPDPSPEVEAAIEAAVAWYRSSRIDGLRREYFTNADGRRDYRMVPCSAPADSTACPPLWARFYTLEGNRPFFCDRDGIPRFDLSEIGHERRNGYSWYNSGGVEVLKRYEEWKKKKD